MFNYDYVIAVSLGAILGALLRWSVSLLIYPLWGNSLAGTLLINLLGCLIAGVCAGIFTEAEYAPVIRLFLFVGFLGSFTTLSALSLEVVSLLEDAKFALAFAVTGLNIGGALLMTFLGLTVVGWLKK